VSLPSNPSSSRLSTFRCRSLSEFEEGSGNVFADLGLEEADELFTRA
jgi:hypothetical protein